MAILSRTAPIHKTRNKNSQKNIWLSAADYTDGPFLGIYKSLTDTWMWKLGLRPRHSHAEKEYINNTTILSMMTLKVSAKIFLVLFLGNVPLGVYFLDMNNNNRICLISGSPGRGRSFNINVREYSISRDKFWYSHTQQSTPIPTLVSFDVNILFNGWHHHTVPSIKICTIFLETQLQDLISKFCFYSTCLARRYINDESIKSWPILDVNKAFFVC